MNKDEINDLTNILRNHCDNTPNEDCVGCDCDECDAKAIINAGYRKVADDEIVIKKQAYEKFVEEFAKQEEIAHSYEQGYTELLETNHQLQDELEKTKKEKKEILQAINKYLVGTRGIFTVKTFRNGLFEDIMLVRADDLETLVNKLAKEHDVELEK